MDPVRNQTQGPAVKSQGLVARALAVCRNVARFTFVTARTPVDKPSLTKCLAVLWDAIGDKELVVPRSLSL
jgi:hypothetical protein